MSRTRTREPSSHSSKSAKGIAAGLEPALVSRVEFCVRHFLRRYAAIGVYGAEQFTDHLVRDGPEGLGTHRQDRCRLGATEFILNAALTY
jgi:hypothetical protein